MNAEERSSGRELEKIAELLERSLRALRDRIGAIGPEQWVLPTPCSEWDVRGVVEHLALSEKLVEPMLRGDKITSFDGDLLGDDPYTSWFTLTEAANVALNKPGALAGRATHPFLGEIDASFLAAMRVNDRVLHGWDVAVAIGFSPALPVDLVEELYPRAAARVDEIPRGFLFGDVSSVPQTADVITRFLAIYGRDAAWCPPSKGGEA